MGGMAVTYRRLLFALLAAALSACSTVTISPDGRGKLVSEPSYQDSKPFFFWGLVGERHVDVLEICGGKEPVQMQSQQTFGDGVLGVITLGIYSPHTTKVWCARG